MRKKLSEVIVGTWRLAEFTLTKPDGEIIYPLGKDATGFIMYTPDGYMSAQLMAQGRPVYASGDTFKGTQEEMAAAALGYMAYSGKYEVDDEKSTLTHHMEVSMNPTWLGQAQLRNVKLVGNRITITTNINTAILIWERCEDHSPLR
jgi:hypothetical protein